MSFNEMPLKDLKALYKRLLPVKFDKITNAELIAEIEPLFWQRAMGGRLALGADYWSNGHFAFYTEPVPLPAAVSSLADLAGTEMDTPLFSLYPSDIAACKVSNPVKQITDKAFTHTEFDIAFDPTYIEVAEILVPNFKLLVLPSSESPALVMRDSDIVGLIMPKRVA